MGNPNQETLNQQEQQLNADIVNLNQNIDAVQTQLTDDKNTITSLKSQLADALASGQPLDFTKFNSDLTSLEAANARMQASLQPVPVPQADGGNPVPDNPVEVSPA